MIAKVTARFPATGATLLPYLEACLRIYNLHGRRDNKYKARIKILVHELGIESLQAIRSRPSSRRMDGTRPWLPWTEAEIARIADPTFARRTTPTLSDEQRLLSGALKQRCRLRDLGGTQRPWPHRATGLRHCGHLSA